MWGWCELCFPRDTRARARGKQFPGLDGLEPLPYAGSMLNRLRRLLSASDAQLHDVLTRLARLEGIEQEHAKQLRELQAERVELLTEWGKTRDQVLRGVKRMGALAGRAEASRNGDLDPEGDGDGFEAVEREAAALKLWRGR